MHILTLIYFDREGYWTKSNEITLHIKGEHFLANTEEETITKANEWVKKNLGPNFTIEEFQE
ncbi:MAG: hypothetical protein WBB37_07355 [bacterium]